MVHPIKCICIRAAVGRPMWKGGLPFYLRLLTHLFVLDTPVWPNYVRHGKSSSGRQRTYSIGISPPPGTPPVAPFGYKSIIVLCVCHRLPLSAAQIPSKSLIARSLRGRGGLMKLANPVTHGHSAGNVPDEWVFNCKRSVRDFCPLT